MIGRIIHFNEKLLKFCKMQNGLVLYTFLKYVFNTKFKKCDFYSFLLL